MTNTEPAHHDRNTKRKAQVELNGGEITIETVVNVTKRGVLPIKNLHPRGVARKLVVTAINKSGTDPTGVTIRILNDDNVAAVLDSGNTIIRRVDVALDAALDPQEVINQEIYAEYATEGNTGVLGVAIDHIGGDGTTDYDYKFRIYGDLKG